MPEKFEDLNEEHLLSFEALRGTIAYHNHILKSRFPLWGNFAYSSISFPMEPLKYSSILNLGKSFQLYMASGVR